MGRAAPRLEPAGSVRSLFEVKHYALVVGINAYDAQVGPLSGAVADARAIASVLSDERRTDRFEVTLLLDAEATRDGIRAAFQALRAKLERAPDARVLIYYAGHGVSATASDDVSADTPGYFLPQDARVGDAGTYLSMAEVRETLDALPCHHLLLVLDCCFAGAFRWLATRAAAPSPRKLYEERVRRYMRDRAWHVITSAAHDEKALDAVDGKLLIGGKRDEAAPEDVHGARSPFAVALVKALRGEADSPVAGKEAPDGVITGSEIHVYIANLFGAWGEKGARRFQVPLFFHWPSREGNKGEFVFLNPAEALRLERAVELVAANNPYRGLEAYAYEPRDPKRPARRPRLFGRDALTRELVAKAEAQPVVAVLGASGSGKSSAVCAGLLPALEDLGWRVVAVVRPGDDPARALRALAVALDAASPEGEPLAAAVARCPDARLVAVVDQLEELVTLRRGEDGREAFFGAVDAAVAASGGRLRVVYTLRSDFEPHFTQLIARHPEGRVRVPSMGMEELRAVIQLPAEERVFSFDPPSLIDEIAKEVVDAPGALPLVSFTLSEMYLRYARAFEGNLRDDRVLTREDYEEVGGVEGSLSRQADRVYEGLPDDASREALRRVMLRAVTLEGGLPARRRVPASELAYADAAETARARRALDALTAARLMVGGEQDGAAYAEPAHDKFVLGWTRLRGWIDAPGERERMEAHRLLREKTADWVRLKREGGWLDRDARLDHWTELLAGALNADEAALLEGSKRHRDEAAAREKRRVKELEEALVRARDQAKMSAARAASNDPTTQIALLRELERPDAMPGWIELANRALNQPIAPLVRSGHKHPFQRVVHSPTGARLLTVSRDGRLMVWSSDCVDAPAEHSTRGDGVLGAAFSSDEEHFLTASKDGAVRRYRADGGGEPETLQLATRELRSADFSRDGSRVATVVGAAVSVWATETGELLTQRTFENEVTSAKLSPDGSFVLSCASPEEVLRWGVDAATEPLRYNTDEGGWVGDSAEYDNYEVEFSPDGQHVLIRKGLTVRLFSADGTGNPAACDPDVQFSAACSSNPPRVLVGRASGDVWVCPSSRQDGESYTEEIGDTGEDIDFVACSPDGARALAMSRSGTTWIWTIGQPHRALVLREQRAESAVFTPDSNGVLMACRDGTVRVWRLGNMNRLEEWNGEGRVVGAMLRSNGLRVVVDGGEGPKLLGGAEESVELPETPLVVTPGFSYDHLCAALLSNGGTRLLTACEHPENDGRLRIVPIEGDGEPVELQATARSLSSAGFSRDEEHVVTASYDGAVRVWSTANGSKEAEFMPSAKALRVACSSDGRLVATGSSGKVQVWSARQGELMGEYCPEGDKIASVDFSPDDTHIVSTAGETAQVWRLDRTRKPLVLQHVGAVSLAVFSPRGERLVTASGNTVHVWSVADGSELASLQGHEGEVFAATFTPDGQHLITMSHEPSTDTGSEFPHDRVRVWAVGTDRLRELLWAATSYCLTPHERMRRLNETRSEAEAIHAAQVERVATLRRAPHT